MHITAVANEKLYAINNAALNTADGQKNLHRRCKLQVQTQQQSEEEEGRVNSETGPKL